MDLVSPRRHIDGGRPDAHCKGKIASFKIPRHWKFVAEFPLTVTGKVQKYRTGASSPSSSWVLSPPPRSRPHESHRPVLTSRPPCVKTRPAMAFTAFHGPDFSFESLLPRQRPADAPAHRVAAKSGRRRARPLRLSHRGLVPAERAQLLVLAGRPANAARIQECRRGDLRHRRMVDAAHRGRLRRPHRAQSSISTPTAAPPARTSPAAPGEPTTPSTWPRRWSASSTRCAPP